MRGEGVGGFALSWQDGEGGRLERFVQKIAIEVVTTNTIESYFSVFKRGMRGTYQHRAEKHLHRYLAEFDFHYNNRIALGVDDGNRADELAKGIVGKRLTYRRPNPKDIPF
jgi:ISXO2-like transposase domain